MEPCKNCGSSFDGKYCPVCGQKKFELPDLAVKKYTKVLPQAKFMAANAYWRGLKQKGYAKAATENISTAVYIEKFDHHFTSYEKYMFFVIIPVFAFLVFLLYSYQKENYYVKHFVYSTHFWCYFLIYFSIVPDLAGLLNDFIHWLTGTPLYTQYDGMVFSIILLAGIVPYTFFALRKVFNERILFTLIKTVIVAYLVIQARFWGISFTYYLTYLTT